MLILYLKNVGNFKLIKDRHSGSSRYSVGCYCYIRILKVSYDLQVVVWHTVPRFM